jgi:UDP-glucose 4-epimerase
MILIVGGAGYVGSHVNKLLNRAGIPTVVFDNLSSGHREFAKWGSFFLGDLTEKGQIQRCFRKYPFQAVMHFSAFADVGESIRQPSKYYLNNVLNTIYLLEVMREFDVFKFIFSSSCAVYGTPAELPISEEHPRLPISPYGRTKFMVEEILKDYDSAYGMKYVSLRYFNAAGADPEGEIGEWHDPETHLIPLAISAGLGLRKDTSLFGTDYPTKDGTCIRDYIHVNDLAEAHIQALRYLTTEGRSDSFNLGNGAGYSVRQVLRAVEAISGRTLRVIETERRPGDPPVLISKSEKARRILGWVPRFSDLKTIVETAWAWHSSQVHNGIWRAVDYE